LCVERVERSEHAGVTDATDDVDGVHQVALTEARESLDDAQRVLGGTERLERLERGEARFLVGAGAEDGAYELRPAPIARESERPCHHRAVRLDDGAMERRAEGRGGASVVHAAED